MQITIQAVSCGMIQENAYIVQAQGRTDCAVIDPGDEYPKLLKALGERTVGAILLTHGHFDHIMAAGPLAERFGAPVYIAPQDMEMLGDASINGYADLMGSARADWPPIEALPFPQRLSIGALTFEVLPTPGHSKGSVCLYMEEEGVLFSGDTLFRTGYGRLDLHGGNVNDMIRSLKRLMQLPPETRVYPGHGMDTTIGAEKRLYRL